VAQNSKLQQFGPYPDQVTPKYRYKSFNTTDNCSMVAGYVGGGAGDPIIGEVASLGGIRIQVATDTHAMMIGLPDDLDVNAPVDFRWWWSSDQTTTADSYTWTLLYTELTYDTTAIAAGATALDTTIAADTNIGTANALQKTAWGTADAGSFTGTESEGYMLSLLLDPAAVGGTPATDLVIVWKLEMRYQPRKF